MPFDIYLRKIAYKLRRNFDEIASDEEIETRIGVMSDFMRGIYKGGVSRKRAHEIIFYSSSLY